MSKKLQALVFLTTMLLLLLVAGPPSALAAPRGDVEPAGEVSGWSPLVDWVLGLFRGLAPVIGQDGDPPPEDPPPNGDVGASLDPTG